MKTFRDIKTIPESAKSTLIAIGNFDGVHRGHRAILDQAKAMAQNLGKPLSILTFEPHPNALFRPDEPPERITPFPLKAEKLAELGVDNLYALKFDWDFASQSAEQFIQNILINGLNGAHIVVGYDFRFGQLRKGTPDMIKSAGIPITIIEEQKDSKAQTYSSSLIRQLLRKGDIDEANHLLGWDWEIRGEIIRGDGRGRKMGFPTANMNLNDIVHPAYGVYASLAKIKSMSGWQKSVTNIGIRPMFQIREAQAETLIFDFDREIYGEILQVRPIKRLRSEAKFDTMEDLIAQMHKDCAEAKAILKDE